MADRKDIRIAYIGGGSMNFGWQFIGELAGEEQLGGTVLLYDIEKSYALTNEVIGNKLRENPACKGKFIYLAVDTPEEALRNADFVILSISVGTPEELVSDIHLPEMFGIYQSVGENTGPGGIIRALRTLPLYIEFAEMIKKCCPNAWVINLTQPMDVCLMTLYRAFPEIKAYGCSNETFAAQEMLATFAAKEFAETVTRRDIKVNLGGIHGFSWFTEALYKGNDLYPTFRKIAEKYSGFGFEKRPNEFKINPKSNANKAKFDLFLRYNTICASSDNAVAEYCPPWYLKTQKTAVSWKIGMTTVNYLKKRRAEQLGRIKKLMNGDEWLRIGYSGNECISQIKSLLGLSNLLSNAELINNGQAQDLPLGVPVQSNVMFSAGSIRPIMSGKLPDELNGMIIRHIYNQKTVVRSVFEKDLDIAFNAFLNDPMVTTDLDSATELYKEMLSGIRSHLVYYC